MDTDTAWLMGNFFGSALWGIYSILFFLTLWTVRQRGTDKLCTPVICGVVVLYILNLGLTGFFAATSYEAFITAQGGPTAYLTSRPRSIIIAVNDFVMFISTIITDLTLVWRLYVIYLRNVRILVVVLALFLGTMISGIGTLTYDVLIVRHGPSPLFVLRDVQFGQAIVCFALVFNWVVTGLIVARLWLANRRLKNASSFLSHHDGANTTPVTQMYQKIIIGVIESGALYSFTWTVFLVAYTMGEAGENIPLFLIPINPRMIGLIPTLIVLQRSLGYMQTSEAPAPPISNVEFAVITTRPFSPTPLASDPHSDSSAKDELRLRAVHGENVWAESSSLSPSTYSGRSHKMDREELV